MVLHQPRQSETKQTRCLVLQRQGRGRCQCTAASTHTDILTYSDTDKMHSSCRPKRSEQNLARRSRQRPLTGCAAELHQGRSETKGNTSNTITKARSARAATSQGQHNAALTKHSHHSQSTCTTQAAQRGRRLQHTGCHEGPAGLAEPAHKLAKHIATARCHSSPQQLTTTAHCYSSLPQLAEPGMILPKLRLCSSLHARMQHKAARQRSRLKGNA